MIEAVLRKHAKLTFRLLRCKFVAGTFVLVPGSGTPAVGLFSFWKGSVGFPE